MLNVGDVVGGRFRIDRVIGIGGFGVVAAATHLELKQQVAIKIVKDDLVGDTEIVERFLREARAVAVLRTEHVCRVLDVSRTEQGTPYIVMDLLEGSEVGAMLRQQGALPLATAVDFAVQACVALADAHPRGIVHRDLKPANLFLTHRPDGTPVVKLLDFGVAKAADELRLTHSMAMLGSPQFMSPEQLTTPRDVDARTDIWSLGVSLYYMLTNRLPFPSSQVGELAVMITTQEPAPIDIDPGLRAVVLRCLEKDRARRYQDVGSLAVALAPYGTPVTQALVRSTFGAQAAASLAGARGPSRSKKLLLVPLAVLLVGGAVAASFLIVRGSKKDEPAETTATTKTKPAGTRPVEAKPVETKPVETKPVETKPVEAKPLPPPAQAVDPVMVEYAKALENTEKQIEASAGDPKLQQSLIHSAVGMACALQDPVKAKAYFARLKSTSMQNDARTTCASLSITL